MPSAPHVELTLSSEAANVSLVREVISGLAATVGLSDEALDDVLTAVSEAVNNVVLHAYDTPTGMLSVELVVCTDAVQAVVRDRGRGIADPEALTTDELSHGVGLAAMQAFSSWMEVSGGPGAGTEVRLVFKTSCERPPPAATLPGTGLPEPLLSSDTRIVIRPASLAEIVFTRVVMTLAARAGFSVDRLSDAELVAAAIATAAGRTLALPELDVTVVFDPRTIELHVGRLRAGAGQRLLSLTTFSETGAVIDVLADEIAVQERAEGELLTVRLYDRPPAT